MVKSKVLVAGGVLSVLAALLHIAVIFGGGDWYRFFGAGETMATLAEAGSLIPTLATLGIASVLLVWGLYAFSGAGLVRRLPFLRTGLALISLVYLARGLFLVPAYLIAPQVIDAFAVWSSLICLGYGVCYALGTKAVWRLANK